MKTAPELVALLGHEVTHVTERHSLKSMFRGAASGIFISMIFGDVSTWLLSKADEFRQMDYSRELETEADNNGLKIMLLNHVDPQGMLALLNILKNESVEQPALMKYLSTHPDTQARIDNIAANPGIHAGSQANQMLEESFKRLQNSVLRNK